MRLPCSVGIPRKNALISVVLKFGCRTKLIGAAPCAARRMAKILDPMVGLSYVGGA